MIEHIENKNSWDIVFDILSDNDKFNNGKSILQIGVKEKSFGVHNWLKMFRLFFKCGYRTFDVLEIWQQNLDGLEKWEHLRNKILGDIRDIDKLIINEYDVIFWWHGPEHIEKSEFYILQQKFDKFKDTLIIIGCPWGEFKQGEVDGNPYEEHKTHWQPEELEKYGYAVYTTDYCNRKDIIGIKYIE